MAGRAEEASTPARAEEEHEHGGGGEIDDHETGDHKAGHDGTDDIPPRDDGGGVLPGPDCGGPGNQGGGQERNGNRGNGNPGGIGDRDGVTDWRWQAALRTLPGLLLSTGHLLPITDIQRLARTSTLMRLVMNAEGQVLDMGRKVRLATPAQRRAIAARYDTCWVDGCPLPASMCQIDHLDNWSEGGLTDLAKLGPACQWHNRDRYLHPDRYKRRQIGPDRWAFTYIGPYSSTPRRT
ncbi:HNH endonuclease signature motif containing protein [Sphaerimonospora thailandensis]|uniref:HNH endonuclease signature motif containing protein n=1 Tax=Sphaerimonospora thailandensis TaxID=795644 RepID=UPI00194E1554|nr:HNH endonuclease signature motif containing protein [Sphaerimonospora thailandensis]